MVDKPKSPLFSNAWYDRVKVLAQIVLPGLATLYFALAQIWGLPKANEVMGTVTAIVTFLGVLLQISTNRYAKGGGEYDGEIITAQMVGGEPVYAIQFESREQQERANAKDVLNLKISPEL
jgi:hypothetical protein